MPAVPPIECLHVRRTLEELCARNTPAEIHYGETERGVRTARTRFLMLEQGAIATDKPQNIDEDVSLVAGQAIRVFFVYDEARWAFASQVLKTNRIVRLNDRQRVLGMTVALPSEIEMLQRRRDFRVSVASGGLQGALTFSSPEDPYACPRDGRPTSALLSNLSLRGAGVVVENAMQRDYPKGRKLFVEFQLPGIPDEFLFLAEVRHLRQVRERGNLLVGLSFLPTPSIDGRRLRLLLSQFLVAEQRKKLRRKR